LGFAVRAHKRKVTTGKSGLVGEMGVARTNLEPEGDVFVQGEIWKAQADQPIKKGEKIVVTGMEGFTLKVTRKKQG